MSVWWAIPLILVGMITGGVVFFFWLVAIWSRDFWQW